MNLRKTLTKDSAYSEILPRLAELTTSNIWDANHDVRLMNKKIKPVGDNNQCVGLAYTVNSAQDSLSIMQALYDDLLTFMLMLNCDINSKIPIILVIAANDADYGLVGGMCAIAAKEHGFGGVVIDGYHRDTKEIRNIGLPFFTTGACANSGPKKLAGEIKVKIKCGGVDVEPGDLILADDDQVVVMNREEAISIIQKAEEIKIKESMFMEKLKNKVPFNQLCNIEDHIEKIKLGNSSSLKLI